MSLSILSQPSTSRAGAALALGTVAKSMQASIAEPHVSAFRQSRPARSLHVSKPVWTSHFDTHLFVQRLEKHGMTRHQAEGVMTVLAEVVDESVKGMEASLVSKAEQEKVDFFACPLRNLFRRLSSR